MGDSARCSAIQRHALLHRVDSEDHTLLLRVDDGDTFHFNGSTWCWTPQGNDMPQNDDADTLFDGTQAFGEHCYQKDGLTVWFPMSAVSVEGTVTVRLQQLLTNRRECNVTHRTFRSWLEQESSSCASLTQDWK